MSDVYDVILAPVVTEKTAQQMEGDNVYTFIVSGDANKIEIGRAVERIWDVTVEGVRTMRHSGKLRRSFADMDKRTTCAKCKSRAVARVTNMSFAFVSSMATGLGEDFAFGDDDEDDFALNDDFDMGMGM